MANSRGIINKNYELVNKTILYSIFNHINSFARVK